MHRPERTFRIPGALRPRQSMTSAARSGGDRLAAGVRRTATAARAQVRRGSSATTDAVAPARLAWLLLADGRPALTARRS